MADESSDKLTYQIEVKVMTHMYGSFCQWLCFDLGEPRWRGVRGSVSQPDKSSDPDAAIHNFGRYTRYIRKLMLECGSRVVYERVRAVREKLRFDRWTRANRTVIKYDRYYPIDPVFSQFQSKLELKYDVDKSVEELITAEVFFKDLNRDNYRHHMRNLITLEELTEQRFIAEYDLITVLHTRESYSVIPISG